MPRGKRAKTRVAVLMPAYNAGDDINRAVRSLIANTHPCDIFIVDDGSDIPVAQTLERFPRTKVIRLEQNRGVAYARNVGLKAILSQSYDYVAILDADDASYPDRIARQVEFLDNNPEIAGVGSWAKHIEEGTNRHLFVERTPVEPENVKKALNYNASVVHTTFMVRADVLKQVGVYYEAYPVAEDYELLRRIAAKFALANIPAVLVDRYISWRGVSLKHRRKQLLDRLRIQFRYFNPGELSAWAGVAKTLLLFPLPVSWLVGIKERKDSKQTSLAARRPAEQ